MLVLGDNMLQVPDEIKSYVVNVKCVREHIIKSDL